MEVERNESRKDPCTGRKATLTPTPATRHQRHRPLTLVSSLQWSFSTPPICRFSISWYQATCRDVDKGKTVWTVLVSGLAATALALP